MGIFSRTGSSCVRGAIVIPSSLASGSIDPRACEMEFKFSGTFEPTPEVLERAQRLRESGRRPRGYMLDDRSRPGLGDD